MITPSFGLTATERVLPKLALDFTTASLDSRITFTRITGVSNPATYVNSSGVITAATNNQPRFDYDPVTLACKGLLIEEARTNQIVYSEDFSNAAWTKSAASISTNSATAPDGASTADKLVEDTSTSAHYAVEQKTGLAVTTYTWSVFAKSAGRDWIYLTEGNNISATAFFNLSNGTVGNVTGTGSPSATITNFGNGWYRCTMTATIIASVFNCQVRLSTGNGVSSYTGDGTSGVYLWGAQLEVGAFATSYIPTTTTALTRNADVAVMTGTNFSDWFNASEGTLEVEAEKPTTNFSASMATAEISDGTLNNRFIQYANASKNSICGTFVGGGNVALITLTGAFSDGYSKTSFGMKASNFNGAADSILGTPVTSGAMPVVDRMTIGYFAGGVYWNGHIKKINYFNVRLQDRELQAISK